MVVDGIGWYWMASVVLDDIGCYLIVLHDNGWLCMVFVDIGGFWIVLDGMGWY